MSFSLSELEDTKNDTIFKTYFTIWQSNDNSFWDTRGGFHIVSHVLPNPTLVWHRCETTYSRSPNSRFLGHKKTTPFGVVGL